MLMVISPAKTLDYETPPVTHRFTQPQYLDHAQELIQQLRQLTPLQISELMKLSDKLAGLNAARYASWHPEFTPENAKQALLAVQDHQLLRQEGSRHDGSLRDPRAPARPGRAEGLQCPRLLLQRRAVRPGSAGIPQGRPARLTSPGPPPWRAAPLSARRRLLALERSSLRGSAAPSFSPEKPLWRIGLLNRSSASHAELHHIFSHPAHLLFPNSRRKCHLRRNPLAITSLPPLHANYDCKVHGSKIKESLRFA